MLGEILDWLKSINDKSPINLRSFWISFVAVALVVILSRLGIKPPGIFNLQTINFKIVNSQPQKINVLESIKPRLEQKQNNFQLKNSTSLIPSTYAVEEYNKATAFTVIDYETGEVLAEKNFNTKTHIASLTKIMTAVVALDLASVDEEFEVSASASNMIPTKIGVATGEKLKLDELINALLLTSANDAAEIIKEGIDKKYGENVFVTAMNEKARLLNLSASRFDNPQGFDSIRNFSTVEDIAILSHYALEQYPLIAEVAKKEYQYYGANQSRGQMDLYNWNGLVGVYPGTFGLKIGNTDWAKYTTVVASQREGKKVLVVMLGAPGVLERDMWASQLLDLGFEKLGGIAPLNITELQLNQKYSSWKYWN